MMVRNNSREEVLSLPQMEFQRTLFPRKLQFDKYELIKKLFSAKQTQ